MGTELIKRLSWILLLTICSATNLTWCSDTDYDVIDVNVGHRFAGVVYVTNDDVETWLYDLDEREGDDDSDDEVDFLYEAEEVVRDAYPGRGFHGLDGNGILNYPDGRDGVANFAINRLFAARDAQEVRVYRVNIIDGFGTLLPENNVTCDCDENLSRRESFRREAAVFAFSDRQCTVMTTIQDPVDCKKCYTIGETDSQATKSLDFSNRAGYEMDFYIYHHHDCRLTQKLEKGL